MDFAVHLHSCSCLLAIDGQVVGTQGVGQCVQAIFTVFMVLGDMVVALLAG